ncbi:MULTISPECIES: TetR/AcrR family transcriptional regulator [unclassified Crossiella]|uniref:TetR/AcrR family transcriptional regulator n=1 Tax=unclassified Crossiella TaxID=2620835 RepID=UPI00200014C0|nr:MULTISPECIES: TetR/AcrR family transcriptional regulator [unclassified Crossiella]MCK2239837.1 TetR/AcrR family transcriptional regulator [Crossiella sp. S99.2]MCK2252545.1 TetR/AcrR family transcriptional regulator [Crossiella sp. S99.1]
MDTPLEHSTVRRPCGPRRRRMAPAARRAELVETAIRVITTHGAGISMDQLAAAAGVSKPLLYHYFYDKAGLLKAAGERATELMLARLRPALAELRGVGVRERWIHGAVEAYLAVITEHQWLYRFTVSNAAIGKHAAPDPIIAALADVLGEIPGLRPSPPPDPVRYALAGMVQAVCHWWLEHRRPGRAQLLAQLSRMIEHTVAGMSALATVESAPLESVPVDLPSPQTG